MLSGSVKTNNKILVVDDDPVNILFLQEALSSLGHIYFSESAEDALTLLTKVLPDIILLDIEMPNMTGWELSQQLKTVTRFAAIPIIFITGHQDQKFEQLSLENGGVDFITKPFNAYVCKLRVAHQLKIVNQTNQLSRTQEHLQQLVKQVPVFITYWDNNWKNTYSNDYKGHWFNHLEASSLEQHISAVFPDKLCQAILEQSIIQQEALDQSITSQDDSSFIVHIKTELDERFFQVFLSLIIKEKEIEGYLVTLVDVSDEKIAKRTLNSEKERLRVTLNSIGDAVIATDTEGYITFMNPIAERLTGWRFRDALNTKIEKVMDLRDAKTGQPLINPLYVALKEQCTVAMAINTELVAKSNLKFSVEDSAAPIRNQNNDIIGAIMVFHDISEATAMAIKMSHLANHDQLTDLPNRILLQDRLSVAIANSYHTKTAVLMVDIDNFKYLNDSLGHQYGDQLICLMAERLAALIPPSYTLSRLGGDEFIIAMTDVNEVKVCSELATKVIKSMQDSFLLDEQSYNVSVSIGISVYPDDASDADQLMRNADVAMYKAKQEGRNRYSFFSEELESALLIRHTVEKLLRHKLEKDDLLVYYQPKFDLKTRKIIGAEALVRLQNEKGEIVSPALFLPTAEETGLVVTLGYQVLFKACRQAKEWLDAGNNIPISVNVAAAQFADTELQPMVEKALAETQLPVSMLELEVTETALMVDITIVQQKLEKLKALGIKISIDDFGTGYSSLAYLKKFNVDVMKIDMSFVRDMMNNKQDYEIVKAIISLGNSMGLSLIAEGVEDEAQLNALIALGCQYGQGYLIGKPVPAKDFKFN
ncbi:MAG: two-component system response regulator [Thalassotalea sp.]